jgi:site-specific recombinase XerD
MTKIQELKKQFLEYLEIEKNRSQKTVENYNHYLKRFFDYAKIKEPKEITPEVVRTYRLYLNRFESPSGSSLK